MTKHDEVRQVLHESGFKFDDGRTALDMTDEEVERWVLRFVTIMADLGQQFAMSIKTLTISLTRAIEPLKDLGKLLEEEQSRDIHGV